MNFFVNCIDNSHFVQGLNYIESLQWKVENYYAKAKPSPLTL